MTDHRDDADLRAAFGDLRSEVDRTAPAFETMVEAARRQAGELPELRVVDGDPTVGGGGGVGHRMQGRGARFAVLGGWVSLAAAAAAVGLLMLNPPVDDADAEFEALVASYTAVARTPSPTAALLDLPGLDLGSVPRIGTRPIRDLESGVDS